MKKILNTSYLWASTCNNTCGTFWQSAPIIFRELDFFLNPWRRTIDHWRPSKLLSWQLVQSTWRRASVFTLPNLFQIFPSFLIHSACHACHAGKNEKEGIPVAKIKISKTNFHYGVIDERHALISMMTVFYMSKRCFLSILRRCDASLRLIKERKEQAMLTSRCSQTAHEQSFPPIAWRHKWIDIRNNSVKDGQALLLFCALAFKSGNGYWSVSP